MNPYIIGITGGSGSGKTLFLNSLLHQFDSNDICLISQDNYYLPREKQPLDENGVKNFDTPESIDAKAFADDIRKIKSGQPFERLEYTFNNPAITPKTLTFNPSPIVVIEGLFVLYYKEVRDLLDLKLFISAKDHIKLKRRIIRDKIERGYDLDDVLYRFEKHVMPTFEQYLEPLKDDADLIIPNNKNFDYALEVLSGFFKTKLNEAHS
ncbi:uridine kinase family protein [Fulvivirga sediminis]|uniref:Uridine kinase n=1 Tax=Fulvivirga sediminis TaxID=2803949 RepID=A0A937JZT1_9BACT|nr:uridine kinase [Fulvivirga sediminis]MBL3656964.1 uridine kinase [Fulvivirga sediminis]